MAARSGGVLPAEPSGGSDPGTADDSSESEPEDCEQADDVTGKVIHRRISTSKAIKSGVSIKEGVLMKQTSSFQRWKKRYFRLKPRKLYYAKDSKSVIFEEIDLTQISVAECSTKNANHGFQIITPFRRLVLCAESRKDMEEWIGALKSVRNKDFYEGADQGEFLSGSHNWYVTSHARPTYCNICREALSGVTSTGLSCEVCKFKAHKRCAVKSANNCKWTTLSSVGKDIIEDDDGNIIMPHQWLEGNLPVSAKCCACEKTCGSVIRLQDWRCLWCKAMVHTACKPIYSLRCPLGVCRASIVAPIALHTTGSEAVIEQYSRPPVSVSASAFVSGASPLLVFVNSKSGDNQGVKFLRRFKQLLNPAQVFDLMNGGPSLGLRMFRSFNPFRILVCAGDGSVSWVLSEIDKLNLHRQCQIGVLPLGTGNDLARVLGWGSVCDDDTQLPQLLEKYERASTKLLDRWSIMTYEGPLPLPSARKFSTKHIYDPFSIYESSVVDHLTKILHSDQHSVVISSARILCETVKDFISKVAGAADCDQMSIEESIGHKCKMLNEKLDSLLKALNEECSMVAEERKHVEKRKVSRTNSNRTVKDVPPPVRSRVRPPHPISGGEKVDSEKEPPSRVFVQRDALMSRANSLKKAIRQIIEHAEKAVDEQNAHTEERRSFMQLQDEQRSIASSDDQTSPTLSLPIFTTTSFDEETETDWGPLLEPWGPVGMGQSVGAPLKDTLQVTLTPIEGGVSLESTPCPSPCSPQSPLVPTTAAVTPTPDSGVSSPTDKRPTSLPLQCSTNTIIKGSGCGSASDTSPTEGITPLNDDVAEGEEFIEGEEKESKQHEASKNVSPPALQSPTASRRISSGSTLKHLCMQPSSSSATGILLPTVVRSPTTTLAAECAATLPEDRRVFPIINPLVELPSWPNLSGESSFIGKALLANADTLCAAASPLMDVDDMNLDGFQEKCVMNNYFGIGLDAKITLEFHNKREEHPEKCRSRTKNLMWYGVLGGKELLQRTYKNLEQRVHLECDGHRIALPSLQGIVVLNIPSYGGGSNFWGGTKEDDVFFAPAMDDKILEVVAVFGTVQMAASRVINLQHHRIAQCRSVRITITGEEGVPVQVDGEAWLQPPGCVCIVHKNRTQILCRNRQYEALKTLHETHRSPASMYGFKGTTSLQTPLTEDEAQQLSSFIDAATALVQIIQVSSVCHPVVDNELWLAASQTASILDRFFPTGQQQLNEAPHIRQQISELMASTKQLQHETRIFVQEKLEEAKLRPDLEEKLVQASLALEKELRKCTSLRSIVQLLDEEERAATMSNKRRGLFRLKFKRKTSSAAQQKTPTPSHSRETSISSGGAPQTPGAQQPSGTLSTSREGEVASPSSVATPVEPPMTDDIAHWSTQQVAQWLDTISMSEYREQFMKHDIQGAELLALERADLKELGVVKVGHIKRILQAIRDIQPPQAQPPPAPTLL